MFWTNDISSMEVACKKLAQPTSHHVEAKAPTSMCTCKHIGCNLAVRLEFFKTIVSNMNIGRDTKPTVQTGHLWPQTLGNAAQASKAAMSAVKNCSKACAKLYFHNHARVLWLPAQYAQIAGCHRVSWVKVPYSLNMCLELTTAIASKAMTRLG